MKICPPSDVAWGLAHASRHIHAIKELETEISQTPRWKWRKLRRIRRDIGVRVKAAAAMMAFAELSSWNP